jgi:hypothetical protein
MTAERQLGETEEDVRYLDLDHDGVPDAVQRSHTVALDLNGDGLGDVVDAVRETDRAIGIDGEPRSSEVRHRIAFRHRRSRRDERDHTTIGVLRGRRADGFAAVRMRPRPMRTALQQLARVSTNLEHVQISVEAQGVSLMPTGVDAAWRAMARIPTRLRRGSPTSVVVPTEELAVALQRAESVHARGVPFVAQADALWIGDNELRATPGVFAPPPMIVPPGARRIARGIVVPSTSSKDGECTFPVRRGSVTTTRALLAAFARGGIARVTLLEESGRVLLAGRRRSRGGTDLLVAGDATMRYC